jgi:polyphosphate:AMP phosphotransferase
VNRAGSRYARRMFESAELGHAIDRRTFDAEVPKLRAALLAAQRALVEKKAFPLVLVIAGFEAAGKGETVRILSEWMDPRNLRTHAMGPPDCREIARPPMWRFWQSLPGKGELGVFFGGWYSRAIADRVYGRTKRAALERTVDEIVHFETLLTDEGAVVLKVWLHLRKKDQKKRLTALAEDPATRWRVKPADWRNHEHYADFRDVSEEVLLRTSTRDAPWVVVEGTDERYRHLTVGRVVLEAMRRRLDERKHPVHVHAAPLVPEIDNRKLLRSVDLTQKLPAKRYEEELAEHQGRLYALSRRLGKAKRALILAFEGPDASGKGGAIRRIAHALDPRSYRIIPVAAPTEDERAHPYLWRFWRDVPAHGGITIYDRSWYGRVLVERVEALAEEADWMRAYSEINEFERELDEHGVVIVKLWLAISAKEQLRRFEARKREGWKRYKITRDDWRNRKKWDDYEQAASDMIDRTSTEVAPWTRVAAEDKHFARITVMKTVIERLEATL